MYCDAISFVQIENGKQQILLYAKFYCTKLSAASRFIFIVIFIKNKLHGKCFEGKDKP